MTEKETKAFLDRQLLHWEERGFGLWAAELKMTGEVIGYVGLAVPSWLPEVLPVVEVGWRLEPAHWGKGLATEGGKASLRHGFEVLGLDRIISICQPENTASVRVMQKLGMRHWRQTTHPNVGVALHVYELMRQDWHPPASPGS